MIRAFIESLLGNAGRAIFNFYEENSLVINGIIIFYGLCVYLAHQAFHAMLKKIKHQLDFKEGKEMGKEKLGTIIDRSELNWDDIKKAAWFPLIAIQGKIAIHLKNKANLQKIFSRGNLVILLIKPDQEKATKAQ